MTLQNKVPMNSIDVQIFLNYSVSLACLMGNSVSWESEVLKNGSEWMQLSIFCCFYTKYAQKNNIIEQNSLYLFSINRDLCNGVQYSPFWLIISSKIATISGNPIFDFDFFGFLAFFEWFFGNSIEVRSFYQNFWKCSDPSYKGFSVVNLASNKL